MDTNHCGNLENSSQHLMPLLLRASQVACILNISESLAYKLLQSGDIPAVRIHRSIRCRKEDLDEYILRCRIDR